MNRMEEVFSVMKKAGPKENVTCQSCQKTASDSFCHTCHQYICAECVKAHKQLQFFRSHEIVSIDSLRSSFSNCSPEKTKLAPCEVKCSKHTDEPLKLYCHDCHKLVCRDCIVIDHKDHRYAFVIDAAPLCKAELGEKAGKVREVSEGLKEAVKSLDESKKKLSDHNTSTMRAIDGVIGKISAKLMEKKAELKKKAGLFVEEAERKIGTQEKGAQLAVGEVESLLEFMSRSLERATDQEVLSLEKQMSDQADRVSRLYGNPAGKFPVPQLPELVVHCGAEVEQAIKTRVSVFDGPPPQSLDSAAALPLSAGGDTPEVTPAMVDDTVEKRPNVFTGISPDALALMQRLREGTIDGVEYNIREGSVRINLSKVDEAIIKLQEAYKKVTGHDHRLRVEQVEIPVARSKEEVEAEIARFEQTYLYTAFVLDEEKRVVRVISQNRQFEQAKTFLEDALKQSSSTSTTVLEAHSVVAQFAQNRTLTLKRGDIVREKADVLVNAANGRLEHGGGVAGALNTASEGQLQAHCDKYMKWRRNVIPAGEVAVTPGGGKLECRHVIHAVGPDGSVHGSSRCEHLLKQVIHNTLKAAGKHNATAIVIPAISCGIFGVSKELVAQCIIDTVLSFNYTKSAPVLSDIRIVILDGPTHSCFAHYLKQKVNLACGGIVWLE